MHLFSLFFSPVDDDALFLNVIQRNRYKCVRKMLRFQEAPPVYLSLSLSLSLFEGNRSGSQ